MGASDTIPYQLSGTIETLQTDETAEQASRVGVTSMHGVAANAASGFAQNSTADLELLKSLAAKIETLSDAIASRPRAAPPRQAETTRDPASHTATVATVAPAETTPKRGTADTAPNARTRTPPVRLPIDSTQTIRALTPLELADGKASRWFAIQLKLSALQIDAAEVPNLGIFEEYKLYSIVYSEKGRLIHALRLGFFSSEVAAEAVARYLTAHFPAPMIRRVSIAERERFADKLVTAGKDIGASGKHAVIELIGAPKPQPEARATATALVESGKRPARIEPPARVELPARAEPPAGVASLLWSRLRSCIVAGW